MKLKIRFNYFADIIELSTLRVGEFQSGSREQTKMCFFSLHFAYVFADGKDCKRKGSGARTN